MTKTLRVYEKMAVMVFISLILVLAKFAFCVPEERLPQRNKETLKARKEQVVIFISRGNELSGRFHFNKGITLKEALEGVKLSDRDIIKHLKLDQVLRPGQKVKIKKLNKPLRLNEEL